MSLPDWLIEKLLADNPDGLTRAARLGTCPDCAQRVLRGIDGDICGWTATATPVELDHYGEYLALARGIRTYYLARRFSASGSPRWELDPRDQWQIANPQRRYAVVPAHRCGAWHPAAKTGLLRKIAKPVDSVEPPF